MTYLNIMEHTINCEHVCAVGPLVSERGTGSYFEVFLSGGHKIAFRDRDYAPDGPETLQDLHSKVVIGFQDYASRKEDAVRALTRFARGAK